LPAGTDRDRNRSGRELLKEVVHDFGALGEGRPDLMPVDAFGDARAAVADQECNVFEVDAVGAQQADEGVPELAASIPEGGARQVGWAMELIGGVLKFMTSWLDTQFDRSNISDVNEMPGAKWGANAGRYRATPGYDQRLSVQVNGTSGHTQPHLATSGECLLSSRSRVRIPHGRTAKAQCVSKVTPGATRSGSTMAAAESNGSGGLAWTGERAGGPGQLPPGRVNYHTRPALAFQQVPGARGHELGDRGSDRVHSSRQRAVPQTWTVPGHGCWRPGDGHRFPPSRAADGTFRLIAPPVPS
jgi:hypothetical protein